ncbi:ABC transporter substrate-binding protein [Adhaeribacter radiodurans]|uniref:ABC transporter substrate-binding protein n=1 Tax=Adhaeribacter radiodurans TaxID=2745197 RepID=A0A7L7LC24_9BACT|nr:helical backbone metal receptor [Adhaeribacter radiodurans]QMU30371.1 ABC transporter substrate-binding protein [Adhaeribacter radiodurans]
MQQKLKIKSFLLGLWCGMLLLLFAEAGCQSKSKKVKTDLSVKEYITITDDLGRKLKIPHYPKRVMALAPSATEMLFAVCDESQIIARTQNCNYPAQVKSKPVVNNYPMDYEKLVQLKPDLIFTVDGITPPEVAARIQELGIPVYFQTFGKLNDIFDRLVDIGRIMHRDAYAMYYADSLQKQLKKIAALKGNTAYKPKVLAITWNDPIYVYGRNTIFTDKLHVIGAENAVTEVMSQPYPALTREYILKVNPDVIIGGTFGKMDSTFFQQYPELKQTNAYQNRRIFAATDDLMSRPSPRVVESVRELQSFLKL